MQHLLSLSSISSAEGPSNVHELGAANFESTGAMLQGGYWNDTEEFKSLLGIDLHIQPDRLDLPIVLPLMLQMDILCRTCCLCAHFAVLQDMSTMKAGQNSTCRS